MTLMVTADLFLLSLQRRSVSCFVEYWSWGFHLAQLLQQILCMCDQYCEAVMSNQKKTLTFQGAAGYESYDR